jgi:hypothetical protein
VRAEVGLYARDDLNVQDEHARSHRAKSFNANAEYGLGCV